MRPTKVVARKFLKDLDILFYQPHKFRLECLAVDRWAKMVVLIIHSLASNIVADYLVYLVNLLVIGLLNM